MVQIFQCNPWYGHEFVKFAILATLGEMLGLRISTGVYHNKTFGIIPRMVIWGVLGVLLAIAAKKK